MEQEQAGDEVAALQASGNGLGVELICAVCMYVRPRPDAEDLGETEILTIKSGVLVCQRHIGCTPDEGLALHYALKAAVRMESRGEFESLSAYQDWRYKQDQPLAEGKERSDP